MEASGGGGTLGFRQEVWTQAVAAIHDFSFTGLGLGAFREIVRLLYPLGIPPTYDIAHAHNFLLQSALDFGLPGAIALFAILWVAIVAVVQLWQGSNGHRGQQSKNVHLLSIGFAGSLAAQGVFGQLDAISMGAKTNFLFWTLVALIFGLLIRTTDSDAGR
ncbi:MAG: hypothetical protein HC802_11140 [Caldilineaceae bacterium]|nr:hypothetical protein [Caldilineaceae bacterium]